MTLKNPIKYQGHAKEGKEGGRGGGREGVSATFARVEVGNGAWRRTMPKK